MSSIRRAGFAVALALAMSPLHWRAHAELPEPADHHHRLPRRRDRHGYRWCASMARSCRGVSASPSSSTTGPAAPASSPASHRQGPSEGYTLQRATSAVMAIRPTLFKQRPFDPLPDFVPISHYVKSPFVFIVNPALPVRSVPEFIKYAKERPGQLSYSSSGIGGAPHLTAEMLKQKFDFDMAHVPYRNDPQSIADVAAGHVAAAIAEAGASLPLIKDGKLRARGHVRDALPDPPGRSAAGRGGRHRGPGGGAAACDLRPPRYPARDHRQTASRDAGCRSHTRDAAEDPGDRPDPARIPLGRGHSALHQGGDREVGGTGPAAGIGGLAVAQPLRAGRPAGSAAFTLS